MDRVDQVNDIIVGGIDQFLPMQEAQKQLLEQVDVIIQSAIKEKSPRRAAEALKSLNGISRMSGLASAKFIYTFSFSWDKFPQSKTQTFEDWADETLGYSKVTVNRYYTVWEMLVSHDIPKEYTDKLKLMPIRCLVPIAKMWQQGWDVSSSHRAKLSNAPDPSSVNKIIREIRGTKPKEGSLQMEWVSGAKQVIGWVNGTPHYINLMYKEDDEVVLKMLARLFGDGRALEK